MKKAFILIIIVLLFCGCNNAKTEEPIESSEPLTQEKVEANEEASGVINTFRTKEIKPIEENPHFFSVLSDEEMVDRKNGLGGWFAFNDLTYKAFDLGGMKDSSNSAILVKHRSSALAGGSTVILFSNKMSNKWFCPALLIDSNGSIDIELPPVENEPNGFKENIGKIRYASNEWYYTFMALDEKHNCCVLVWQENNPKNNAYYKCNINKYHNSDSGMYGRYIQASVDFSTNEQNLHSVNAYRENWDLASFEVFEFNSGDDITAIYKKNLHINEETNSSDIIAAINDSSKQVINYTGDSLVENMNFDWDVNKCKGKLLCEDGYVSAKLQTITNDMARKSKNQFEQASYKYSGEEEKYQLAVELFESGDYYNAYLLFDKLNGYGDSQSYLDECKQKLQTIDIQTQEIANAIGEKLIELEMPIYDYLYVYQVEKIESIDLTSCKIEDLTFIKYFTGLKELKLDRNAIYDLTPIKDLYSLETLSLDKNNIVDVKPLSNLTNLKYLNLANNMIEDVSGLENLSSLSTLDLSTNNLTAIVGLEKIENLESVDLSCNFITSVKILSDMQIKELNIMNTYINNLVEVSSFTQLETLKAGFVYNGYENNSDNKYDPLPIKYEKDEYYYGGLTGVEHLSKLNSIKNLNLSSVKIDSIEPLLQMSNLESLSLRGYTGTSEFEILNNFTKLKELSLNGWGNEGIEDLSFLYNMPNLEKLDLMGFHGGDYSPVSSLVNLQELRTYNNMSDISFIKPLKNLRLLTFVDCWDISDFTPLLGSDNLEYLEFRYNSHISDFKTITQIDTLKYLRVDAGIDTIEGVENLQNLEYLKLGSIPIDLPRENRENHIKSHFEEMSNIKYLEAGVWLENGNDYAQYGFGTQTLKESIEEPADEGIEIEASDYYILPTEEHANSLPYYNAKQNLVISFENYNQIQPINLKIPHNVRNLYLIGYDNLKIVLDCEDHKGLERIAVSEYNFYDFNGSRGEGGRFTVSENLDGLKGCTNLKEIYMEYAGLSDISGLEDCDKLEVLHLQGNRIRDISVLADKENLKEVQLLGNGTKNKDILNDILN